MAQKKHPGNETLGIDDPRVKKFALAVGPDIAEYIGEDPACVVGIPTGGTFYAMALRGYLLLKGKDVAYAEFEKTGSELYENYVGGRKVIVVDDAISTGTTYRNIKSKLDGLKDELGILDIKYAVENDIPGLADFSPKREGISKEEETLWERIRAILGLKSI